jgi:glyoxylase-like metal-dependent hydrolase (beta-lactamase superfamily II)
MAESGTAGPAREVLAVKCGYRVTTRAQSYLNYHLYGEPDADLHIDYFFWVVKDPAGVFLIDTGFSAETGARRRREHYTTPARALPRLGVDPGDVTAVVVTHAHWDHSGNVAEFPNAQVVMTEAEYGFWTSPLAGRRQFAEHSEAGDIALLGRARAQDRLTLFTGRHTLAPGIELIEVGGHTPGQLVAAVATPDGGTRVLASDAVHFYDEVERDRPFAVLPAMYRAYDTLAQLANEPGTHLVAGHDPLVRARFAPRVPATGTPGETGGIGNGTDSGGDGAPLDVTDLTKALDLAKPGT